MPYKIFFVEDEVVTREGIRDNVDWKSSGFEFCGEAADGEMALPLLYTARPDVLITDIKMPFMDGLQLSKLVRERLPGMKIIILSGHDEFQYAQEAINLGITDYLLKPVTVQKLQTALRKLTVQLDQERTDQEHLKKLQDQVEENQATLRERLLQKLVVGAVSPVEAIQKSQLLGLNLIASYYLIVIVKIELAHHSEQFDYEDYQLAQQTVAELAETNPDILLLKKDWGDLILIMKGNTPEALQEARDQLLADIKQVGTRIRYQLTTGIGTSQKRIADIHQSYGEALVNLQDSAGGSVLAVEQAELLRLDKSAVENYLRCGLKDAFDEFFSSYIRPLGEAALKSKLIRNYIFVDLILAAAKLVNELGGDIDKIVPELNSVETLLLNIKTPQQLQQQANKIFSSALTFRDGQPNDQCKALIRQAKEFIEQHYTNPDLSLVEVAGRINLSPSHFSVVFSRETLQTFKGYLIAIRIRRAKELLRTTALKSAEIALQVGYNDPHYFSSVFKKYTGRSPIEFRSQI